MYHFELNDNCVHLLVENVERKSCKWNKIDAQYSQYISSILFITSTCFGSLQFHHREE